MQLAQQSFRYDRSGNRVVAGAESSTVLASFTGANKLQRVGGAGSTLVEGEIDKGGSVASKWVSYLPLPKSLFGVSLQLGLPSV